MKTKKTALLTLKTKRKPAKLDRRAVVKTLALGGASTAAFGLSAPAVTAGLSDKILLGVPSSLSTPYGVADDTDHLNGTTLAMEEINASGGILGRVLVLSEQLLGSPRQGDDAVGGLGLEPPDTIVPDV